jgi:hypothetical protein
MRGGCVRAARGEGNGGGEGVRGRAAAGDPRVDAGTPCDHSGGRGRSTPAEAPRPPASRRRGGGGRPAPARRASK